MEIIYNETDLLTQVAGGDRAAFRHLYKMYFPLVRQYVALFEPAKERLDELTQDIFVRIWEKRARLPEVVSFKNYLFLVCRNLVFNYFRALKIQKRNTTLNLEYSTQIPAQDNSESELLFKQYYHIVMEAIEKLPEGRRKVLKMSIEAGMSLDEIAAALQISRSGVKNQLYAATAFIRQYLQQHGEMSLLLFVFLSLFEG